MTSSPPMHKHPVLLFPLRLETRFYENELLVRIYPDDVLVHAHDEHLNAAEYQALQDYNNVIENIDARGDKSAVWSALVERVGRRRAAYLISITDPDRIEIREESFSGAPRACLLPDGYAAYLYNTDGKLVVDKYWAVNLDQRELPLLADSPNSEDETDPLYADQAAWIADFAAAEYVGMAVRISNVGNRYSRLIVVGLNGDDPKKGGEDLASLLEAHRFSSGIALLPYGTVTSNTAEVRSGYTDDEEDAGQSYEIECCASDVNSSTLGGCLAKALGITSSIFENLAHSKDERGTLAEDVRTLLWPALGDYFMNHLLLDQNSDSLSPDDRNRLWEHFRSFVDARGALPSLRVGKQPYSVLPVTGIRAWKPSLLDAGESVADTEYSERFDSVLHKILREMFERWLHIANDTEAGLVPQIGRASDIDQELLEILSMQPASVAVHLRSIVDDRFMGWNFANYDEKGILDNTDPNCSTLEKCTQFWVDQFTGPRRPVKALLENVGKLKGVSRELGKAKILDVYAWGEDSPTLEELNIPLVDDAGSLDYIKQFKQPENSVPEQDKNKPLLYDLLRRAIAYKGTRGTLIGTGTATEIFNNALEKITDKACVKALEDAVRDVLDLHSHRLDAWITSLATRRLDAMRQPGAGAAEGTYTGAYGWVEDLQQAERFTGDKSGGYIHAPSPAQAAAGAVLRNAYLSHSEDYKEDNKGNAYRINLSSERVRRAWRLVQGIREGQELGALLGYQFERGLHDTGSDQYIDEFRKLYPVVAHSVVEPESDAATESVAARNVVDGLALARAWIEYHNDEVTEPSRTDRRTKMRKKWASVGLSRIEATELLNLPDNAVLKAQLEQLSDTLDAVLDLLLYESVYQQVQGNYERSSAALDAMVGDGLPPEPESIQTPLAGTAFTQRVCVLLQAENDGAVSTNCPRAIAEPTFARWFAELLGDMREIGCIAKVIVHRNDTFEIYQPPDLNEVTSAELAELASIEESLAQAIVAEREANGPFQDVCMAVTRISGFDHIEEKVIKELGNTVTVDSPQVVSLSDLGIEPVDFLYLCTSIPEGLLSSLGFKQPTDEDRRAGETELEARIKYYVRERNWLGPNCEVAIDFGPNLVNFSRSFAEAIEVSQSVLALLAGASHLRPAMLARPEQYGMSEELVTYRNGDYRELYFRLKRASGYLENLGPDQFFAFSRFGIESAIPPSSVRDPDEESRRSAMKKATDQRLNQCRLYRQEACKLYSDSKDEEKSFFDRQVALRKAIETLVEAMKALFGAGFVVLPTLSILQKKSFFEETALLIEDEQRIHLWLQQAAQTHSGVCKLEDTLLATDAWQTPVFKEHSDWDSLADVMTFASPNKLRVVQLSDGDTPYWLALSDAEIAARASAEKLQEVREEITENGWPRGVLSLVCWVPQPITHERKITGLFIDEWNELIPSAKRATGISFQYDGPNAQAPQALLLAVPGTDPGDQKTPWTLDELREIVNDTLDLAKVRAVDVDALDETIGGLFPANIVPSDAEKPGWVRDIKMDGLMDAIRNALKNALTGSMTIRVKNQVGEGIAGVKVEIPKRGLEDITDTQGVFTFSDVPIGDLTVTASHDRYHEAEISIALSFRESEEIDFDLELLPGTVEGNVKVAFSEPGKPIPLATPRVGVRVTLGTQTDVTNDQGFYHLSNVAPGEHTVTASLLRCTTTKTVEVTGGGDTDKLDFTLLCTLEKHFNPDL